MLTFVTSLNKKYWDLCAEKNIRSWLKFFPGNCNIHIYVEDDIENKPTDNRITYYNLYDECPELVKFKEKHKDDPHYNGEKVQKELFKFKWNAIKFAHKTFAVFESAKKLRNGAMVWLDADVLAIQKMSSEFVKRMCPEEFAISYLGRPNVYSECGFVYYNLNKKETHDFLKRFEECYTLDGLSQLRETHDSFVFDHIRTTSPFHHLFLDINSHSITNKHPFHESLLRACLTHNKGHNKERKQAKFIKRYGLNDI